MSSCGATSTQLGERRVEATSPNAAAGITVGYRKKTYFHTDPNEDAVAIVAGTNATMRICADGHNGFAAPREALGILLVRHYEVPPSTQLSDEELTDLWHGVNGSPASA